MKLFDVTVKLDEEDERTYLVWAPDEQAAVDTAAEQVRSLVVAEALLVRYPDKVDTIDYDGVLGQEPSREGDV
jgi:hypothetical protein